MALSARVIQSAACRSCLRASVATVATRVANLSSVAVGPGSASLRTVNRSTVHVEEYKQVSVLAANPCPQFLQRRSLSAAATSSGIVPTQPKILPLTSAKASQDTLAAVARKSTMDWLRQAVSSLHTPTVSAYSTRTVKGGPAEMHPINQSSDILSFATYSTRTAMAAASAATGNISNLSTSAASNKGPRKFMVCVDGSDNAFRALDVATRLMNPAQGDTLLILTIPPVIEINPGIGDDFIEALHKERDESMKALVQEAADRYPHLKNSITTLVGTPAGGPRDEIVELADQHKVDFIVMGSRGLSPVKRLLLGSVSNYVVSHAHCNVVVVK